MKLSPSEVETLVGTYQAGESQAELARQFGLHEQTVRAHLRRQGVAVRPVRVLTEEHEDDVVRLYVGEVRTLAELATKFGVSAAAAVRQVLVRRGVERRAQARRC